MGDRNSSITRVWPVFDYLFADDPTGESWLRQLIGLAPSTSIRDALLSTPLRPISANLGQLGRRIPSNVKKHLTPAQQQSLRSLRYAFEVDLPAPKRFLEWLLANPHCLSWPPRDAKMWQKGDATTKLRKRLRDGDAKLRLSALEELASTTPAKAFQKWWAFEGRTSVDCYLETDEAIILIEGKRTESVAGKTFWYKSRDQLIRNIETAAQHASTKKKEFAVLLCAEDSTNLAPQTFAWSLPHLTPTERTELQDHYLGCVTWEQIRAALLPTETLPEGVADAVVFCSRFRP
jgi:hypothetical protein